MLLSIAAAILLLHGAGLAKADQFRCFNRSCFLNDYAAVSRVIDQKIAPTEDVIDAVAWGANHFGNSQVDSDRLQKAKDKASETLKGNPTAQGVLVVSNKWDYKGAYADDSPFAPHFTTEAVGGTGTRFEAIRDYVIFGSLSGSGNTKGSELIDTIIYYVFPNGDVEIVSSGAMRVAFFSAYEEAWRNEFDRRERDDQGYQDALTENENAREKALKMDNAQALQKAEDDRKRLEEDRKKEEQERERQDAKAQRMHELFHRDQISIAEGVELERLVDDAQKRGATALCASEDGCNLPPGLSEVAKSAVIANRFSSATVFTKEAYLLPLTNEYANGATNEGLLMRRTVALKVLSGGKPYVMRRDDYGIVLSDVRRNGFYPV
jgi:hypothetical protein